MSPRFSYGSFLTEVEALTAAEALRNQENMGTHWGIEVRPEYYLPNDTYTFVFRAENIEIVPPRLSSLGQFVAHLYIRPGTQVELIGYSKKSPQEALYNLLRLYRHSLDEVAKSYETARLVFGAMGRERGNLGG